MTETEWLEALALPASETDRRLPPPLRSLLQHQHLHLPIINMPKNLYRYRIAILRNHRRDVQGSGFFRGIRIVEGEVTHVRLGVVDGEKAFLRERTRFVVHEKAGPDAGQVARLFYVGKSSDAVIPTECVFSLFVLRNIIVSF